MKSANNKTSYRNAGARRAARGWRAAAVPGLALVLSALVPSSAQAKTIVGSKHDLSVSGAGPLKAETETGVCIFCHTPHKASGEAPLWNRNDSGAFYTPYDSTTVKGSPGQPTGASKLCLSCHDGTVALGMVRSRSSAIPLRGGTDKLRGRRSSLGTDLADDHPVSFAYDRALSDANGQLRDPATIVGPVHLDKKGQLQCTACHNPHDDRYGKFLACDNSESALCVTCHDQRYWASSIHRTSTKSWNKQSTNPWQHTPGTTVAANGCENCHTPHVAGTKPRLLNFAGEEQNCYPCHNGNVAAKNIEAEFSKPSVHDVAATSGVHDPTEDPLNAPRHVECEDCHNPHAVRTSEGSPLKAAGGLSGVRGMNAAGSVVNAVSVEYELCLRCHADVMTGAAVRIRRQYRQTDKRLALSQANASYHAVLAPGRNPDVPSLIKPYTVSSRITCTDCHNNDQGPGAGGPGPNGPHGSAYAPLLERRLILTDYSTEGPDVYALCYKCHSRRSILDNESFPGHRTHVQDEKVACTTCHDPHGVNGATALMNFNVEYVSADKQGQMQFVRTGRFQGSCSLSCHGAQHEGWSYGGGELLGVKPGYGQSSSAEAKRKVRSH